MNQKTCTTKVSEEKRNKARPLIAQWVVRWGMEWVDYASLLESRLLVSDLAHFVHTEQGILGFRYRLEDYALEVLNDGNPAE